jgi:hypothetical protein
MAHYALIDNNNIVTQVIVGHTEDVNYDWEAHYADRYGCTCKRTSYNMRGGVHSTGGTAFRKNYAGIGYTYDSVRDAFIAPKPYASWILNEDTCYYEAPTPMPTDDKIYGWDEDTESWEEMT